MKGILSLRAHPLGNMVVLAALGLALAAAPSRAADPGACTDAADQVQGAYLAYYHRSADPGGWRYWTSRLEAANCDLGEIVAAFSDSAELADLYSGKSNSEILDTAYRQLFNREPDPAGKDFYLGLLDSGARSLESILLDIYNGATGSDAEILANKLEVSNYFTEQLEGSGAPFDGLRLAENMAVLASVTESPATVPTATAQIDQLVGPWTSCASNIAFGLQLLHSSDNESSFQDPNTLEEKILNYATVVEGLAMVAEMECWPSVHVTVGDHTLPGPFYQASEEVARLGAPGLGDIAMYNAMLVEANGMGNHEFDGGINDFARMLDAAEYPFIAVNLDFSQVVLAEGTPPIEIGTDAGACDQNRGKVVKSCWIPVGEHRIGLIGRAPADFFNIVNDPDTTLPGLDFIGGRDADNQPLVSAVGQVLDQVDLLEAQGIERIVLLDHAQDFTGDPLSASALRGIDIIASAGSTGFLAQPAPSGPFNLLRPEDTPEGDYPTLLTDSEGNPVLVVNNDQQYRYVGNLMVTFDSAGQVVEVDARSGPVATTAEGITALEAELGSTLAAPAEVESVFRDLQAAPSIVDAFTVIGTTVEPLNGVRADVRSRETNLGRLAADSSLWFAREEFPETGVDVALKNGGGIRDTISGPSIIRLTIKAALAFDNQLAILELTGPQLLAAMENAVSRVPATDGRFPHVAGMTLEYDAAQPALEAQAEVTVPSRVRTLIVTRADGSTQTLVEDGVAVDLAGTFILATNDFLSTGGDGYAALALATKLAVTDTGEQEILERFIVEELNEVVDLPDPPSDGRVIPVAVGP